MLEEVAACAARGQSFALEIQLHYKPKVDTWALYDNAGPAPQLLEWGENT